MLLLLVLLQVPRVPADCVVEKAAASPLVERPIMAGFDDKGRLYVADSSGVNLRIDELKKQTPHRIVRLEDVDGDGLFDTSVVFADRMTFPMGALWHDGALFVCAPPSVWRLRDVDGDGKADERTELVTGFGSNGNAADIHGPFLGPEGRIWWTDGRHGHNIKRADGTVMAGKAARIFRCKPDGSDLEVVAGGGMDNPVEIAFTPEGEPLVTVALLHAQPRRIDSIIYAIDGGVFPYHEVVKEFKRTGDLLPSSLDVGWVAPSGFVRARGPQFGGAWFSAQFNPHKVQRHVIERDGAGFKGSSEDFLVSAHEDFHPTDVLEAPDGSLLVLDTGGWFRIGCPTSRVDKPLALGAIWRVRSGAKKAVEESPADAVWARYRRGEDVKAELSSTSLSARLAAARAAGLDRNPAAAPKLRELLEDPSPALRREAATSLGRIRDKEAVGPLLELSGDRFLEHAVVYALIQIGDVEALRPALKRRSRSALIALDQLDALSREEIAPLIDPSDPALLKAALDIVAARGWAAEIVSLLRTWLAGPPREEIRGLIVAFAKDPAVQDLVARAMRETPRVALLEAMAQAPLDRLPAIWLAEARWALDSADPAVVRQAVATLRFTGEADGPLLAIAGDAARPAELRVEALAALKGASLDEPRFALLREALVGPPLLRLSAAQALGAAALTEAQLLKLTEDVAKAQALELPRLLAAYERPNKQGEKLLAALAKAPGVESLSAEAVRRTSAAPHAAALLKRLEGDVEAQRARLAELAPALEGGDPQRGREMFQKASCAACHAVAGQGGRVGPDLTKIGGIRAPKDLLESIVFPSLSFVRGYEPTAIRTHDGSVLDGVIARETGDAVTLTLADRTERRVPRSAIAALAQGKTSIMPQGLDRQLSAAELRDLIAYLASLK